jgi:hypothetical protein
MKHFLATTTLAAVLIGGSSATIAGDDSSRYRDLWELKQLHAAFHKAVSHAGIDPVTKLQHLADQLSLWTDDGVLIVGGVTYAGKGTPGTGSCDPGSQTLCDFFANHAGSFVLGRDWVSLTPIATENLEVLNRDTASIYFQCIYVDVNNGDKVMSNATLGLPGQPGSAQARRVHGHWLFSYVMAGSVALPTLDVQQ